MQSRRIEILLVLVVGLLTIFSIRGIQRVPSHPDESTQLYMSSDLEARFKNSPALAWQAEKKRDARQVYRELDAPLTKYIIGLGRAIAVLEPLPVDWDWSKTWQENKGSGALPALELLFTVRLIITLLLPFSLLFTFLVGKSVGERVIGFMATLLLGLNALILLHDHRAMAEGALTLGIVLALWGLLQGDKSPLSGNILGGLIHFMGIFALVCIGCNPFKRCEPPNQTGKVCSLARFPIPDNLPWNKFSVHQAGGQQ